MHGELKAFVEAFLWIGLDMGFSKITLFEARQRFIDAVIAKFEWECVHDAPADIAQLSGNTLTLQYFDSPGIAQHYTVDVLDVDQDLTLARLAKDGYLDSEFMTKAEEVSLRDQLAGYRNANNGQKVIVVSTGTRAEVFLDSQVNKLVVNGTSLDDQYLLKRLNGVVDRIEINAGAGADSIELTADSKGAKLGSLSIDGGAGEDHIKLDGNLFSASAAADVYFVSGGAANDSIEITGTSFYTGTKLAGGAGDDTIFGGAGNDHILGERGFDVLFGYDGNDLIEGGDEIETGPNADLATYTDADGKLQVSRFYQTDGTRFAAYKANGMPDVAPGTLYSMRFYQGDVIDGGEGNDEIHGGQGYDDITGGAGFNTIYGDSGNDTIDAGSGPTFVDGGAGDDVIRWIYKPFTGAGPTLNGGTGGEQDGDTLDVKVDLLAAGVADTVHLAKANANISNTDALMTVGTSPVLLQGVENVKVDVGANADDVVIDDLLDTTVRTVDVQLGTHKATMLQADRGVDGSEQVYSDNYGGLVGDGSVSTRAYFYRYDLAPGGNYLFNADGSPKLESVVTPAAVRDGVAKHATQALALADGLDVVQVYYGNPAYYAVLQGGAHEAESLDDNNTTQRFWLADGVKRTTLFYGQAAVSVSATDKAADLATKLAGVDDQVTVTGSGSQADPFLVTFKNAAKEGTSFLVLTQRMTAADVDAALESIGTIGVDHATVTGSGTHADPWVVTLLNGASQDDAGNFFTLTEQHAVQSFIGAVAPRDDTRVFEHLYRLADDKATYLYNANGTPDLATVSQAATAVQHNAVQQLSLAEGQASGVAWYGSSGVAAAPGMTPQALEARLQGLEGVGTITLTRGTGATAPWTFAGSLHDSTTTAAALKSKLQSVVGGFTVAVTGSAASGWQFTSTQFQRDIAAADLENALLNAAGILEIGVSGTGTAADPWEFSFRGATHNIALLERLGLAENASAAAIGTAVRATPSVAATLGVASASDARIAQEVRDKAGLLQALGFVLPTDAQVAAAAKSTRAPPISRSPRQCARARRYPPSLAWSVSATRRSRQRRRPRRRSSSISSSRPRRPMPRSPPACAPTRRRSLTSASRPLRPTRKSLPPCAPARASPPRSA